MYHQLTDSKSSIVHEKSGFIHQLPRLGLCSLATKSNSLFSPHNVCTTQPDRQTTSVVFDPHSRSLLYLILAVISEGFKDGMNGCNQT